jgi:predicted outer membrane lipoprotein
MATPEDRYRDHTYSIFLRIVGILLAVAFGIGIVALFLGFAKIVFDVMF